MKIKWSSDTEIKKIITYVFEKKFIFIFLLLNELINYNIFLVLVSQTFMIQIFLQTPFYEGGRGATIKGDLQAYVYPKFHL